MAAYEFITVWLLEADRERVWDTLAAVTEWPGWWRGVERVVELAPGDGDGVGRRYEIEWRSRIPYPLSFEFEVERVDRPVLMDGRARGDLDGRGRWRLFEDGGVTAVTYEWQVETTKRWMNLLAPVARPLFAHNHDVVMAWGGEELARRLGAG